ncbi:type II secretion system protein GspM [Pseudomonas vancouverensis]|uniref:Type II secretion system protein M n=1 Tax=Pseudomonas vancouverensis TaxID=95300 RepID=A0A1H2PBF1_PSEVA|nr:type II secretion system protein GspM [Pseudomonas vancouverensis]KAB0493858.1 type II secretion system protein M [Pseudomonas vancouverensis]TDB58002.1 type II secretion system protein M [Pseudomonas vancouverensis]SDV15020.1 general secretion pathway protein M [Pseudomonas vancouverensis]
MKQAWQRISAREQRLLQMLAAFLSAVVAYSLIWQPTRQRLESAERQYQQQAQLAAQLLQATPRGRSSVDTRQPFSLRISQSASVAGLEIHQMETDAELLRLTLNGTPQALLQWLDGVEREGVALHTLTLEKRDARLEARVVLR